MPTRFEEPGARPVRGLLGRPRRSELCGPALFADLHDPTFSRFASWANRGHGRARMLIAVLAAVAAISAAATFVVFRAALRTWWGRAPATAAAEAIEEHTGVRRFVHNRLEADVATGLALTVALAAIVVAGLLVAALAVAVRHAEGLSDVDSAAALWANRHTSPLQHRLLEDVSALATTTGVIVIAVAVGALEWMRVPSRTIPAFLVVVTVGDSLVTNAVKGAIDRARPAIDPVAATLGPSFPSGHSSTAASLFAALALLAGRHRGVRARAALAGAAVGLAVAVACSRVMLDLHWTSDVVGGLALGWGWFAACAIAFGGWLVEFGAPVERVADRSGPVPVSLPGGRPTADASAAAGGRRPDRPAPPGRS
jgi:undecaprenyl-diphosphatase